MNDWRHYLDVTVAGLAIAVALYYRADAAKRQAFEARFPRIAALIGMVAAIVPFLPMLLDNGKRLVTPPHATPVVAHSDSPVPTPPWAESIDQPSTVEADSGTQEDSSLK